MDAQQAAERAAEKLSEYPEHAERVASVILAEFAPLLAEKDADAAALREIAKKCGYEGHEGRGPAVTIVRHIDRLAAEVAELRRVLQAIRQWDHLDTAGDGPYWKETIDAALAAQK